MCVASFPRGTAASLRPRPRRRLPPSRATLPPPKLSRAALRWSWRSPPGCLWPSLLSRRGTAPHATQTNTQTHQTTRNKVQMIAELNKKRIGVNKHNIFPAVFRLAWGWRHKAASSMADLLHGTNLSTVYLHRRLTKHPRQKE